MDAKSFQSILDTISNKVELISNNIKIISERNDDNYNKNDLEIFINLIKYLDILSEYSENLKLNLNLRNFENLNVEEKIELKHHVINEKIMEKFKPYILYAKLCSLD
jgi:hypothetical protein